MHGAPFRLHPSFLAGRAKRRLARRMACGVPADVAALRLGITDEDLDAITDFPDLVDAYRRLRGRPRDEILKELAELALGILLESVEERDPKICAWYFRERQHGRDPCVTMAHSVVRARERAEREAQREAEATPPPPKRKPRPRPEYDDLEALRHRITVQLRDQLIVEAAHMAADLAPAGTAASPTPKPAAAAFLSRRLETEVDRDLRHLIAELMNKRVRDPEPDTS